MSGRYHGYDKGSSRSARDDSRRYERSESRREENRRSSRSRSPRRRHSPKSSSDRSHSSQDRDRNKYGHKERQTSPTWEIQEEVPAPPPPPRITKISIGFTKPKAPIKMSLGGPPKPSAVKKPAVASVFNTDDDDEPEEMPAEAKMRMRNIGRETPTSAGPNSFGKTKQGFCDAKKVFEKNLKQALDTVEKPTATKFPQTIYKISGP